MSDLLDELARWLRRRACRLGRHRFRFNGGDVRCMYCGTKKPMTVVELPPTRED